MNIWQFSLIMFVITSVLVFLFAILDKDFKKRFDIPTIIVGSIIFGAMTGVFSLVLGAIEQLIYLLLK